MGAAAAHAARSITFMLSHKKETRIKLLIHTQTSSASEPRCLRTAFQIPIKHALAYSAVFPSSTSYLQSSFPEAPCSK